MEHGWFKEQLKALPTKPGVYLFKDEAGKVLYVGKAASLRQRVRSYFGAPHTHDSKLHKMMSAVWDLDFIVSGEGADVMNNVPTLL